MAKYFQDMAFLCRDYDRIANPNLVRIHMRVQMGMRELRDFPQRAEKNYGLAESP